MWEVALDVIFTLIALQMVWKLLQGGLRAMAGQPKQPRDAASPPAEGVHMVKDPVCGTYVVPDRAVSVGVGRQTLYFCSTACRDKYRAKSA